MRSFWVFIYWTENKKEETLCRVDLGKNGAKISSKKYRN